MASDPSQEPTPARPELHPWGPWATLGWTLALLAGMLVTQLLVLTGFVAVSMVLGRPINPAELATSGLLAMVATLVSTPVTIGLAVLLIRLRRQPVRAYLNLVWPPTRHVVVCVLGLAFLLAATDLTTYALGRPIVPDSMVAVYKTCPLVLLWLVVVVAAPVGEEVVFRGFFFRGIAAGWGPVAAVVLSSVVFGALHVQYDLYGIGTVLLGGIYLGLVRFKTGSLPTTILLHALSNAVATVEVMVKVHATARVRPSPQWRTSCALATSPRNSLR